MFSNFFKNVKRDNTFLNFIDSKWVASSDKDSFEVFNPYTGKALFNVQNSCSNDVKKAINSAVKGKDFSRKVSFKERSAILSKCAELLKEYSSDFVKVLCLESGKPVSAAEGEVKTCIDFLEESSREVLNIRDEELAVNNARAVIHYKPAGLVVIITPFNYPLYSVVSKFSSAFCGGNSMIIKPSSDTPVSALLFTAIAVSSGVPAQCINTITGKSSKIGDSLTADSSIDMINFTGSSTAGEAIIRSGGVKRYLLELGGKCAAIILNDADLDLAASECVKGAFKISGQRCDAVSRVLIVDSAADVFVTKVLNFVKSLKIGDPSDKSVNLGPLINRRAVENVDSLVSDAVSKGAKLLCGGKFNGQVYEPTVLDNVTTDMKIAWQETFGPVLPVIRVKDEDAAIRISNMSEYGLDSCVFTKNEKEGARIAELLDDGSTTVNASPSHGIGRIPFGGNKKSGFGREGVKESIYEMMNKKIIKIVKS